MKKKLIYFLLLLLSISLLAGCGSNNSSLQGRFDLVTMEVNGIDAFVMFEAFGLDISGMHMEFYSGNRYRVVMPMGGSGGTVSVGGVPNTSGTFTVSGHILRLSADNGDDMMATIRSNRITFYTEEDGERGLMVFERSRRRR